MWDEEEAEREEILKVMNRSPQRITIESLTRWKGEQEDDSHEEEEGNIPAAL